MDVRTSLEQLLADGRDSATLRFALGSECLKQGEADLAVRHLSAALQMDPAYSAAWKLLGQAQIELGRRAEAKASYVRGIEVARARGDEQAAREMQVFLRRLERESDQGPPEQA